MRTVDEPLSEVASQGHDFSEEIQILPATSATPTKCTQGTPIITGLITTATPTRHTQDTPITTTTAPKNPLSKDEDSPMTAAITTHIDAPLTSTSAGNAHNIMLSEEVGVVLTEEEEDGGQTSDFDSDISGLLSEGEGIGSYIPSTSQPLRGIKERATTSPFIQTSNEMVPTEASGEKGLMDKAVSER